ncbi:MAG: SH3 domain-containing protein [Thiobacillaceae bacterium]|jgi:hypothetical protein|nr:SH3 domain-containing protein [Thiobacillaceae bacterium]
MNTIRSLRYALLGAFMVLALPGLAATGTMIREEPLRASASSGAAVVGSAGRGASVEILARQGGWTQVRVAGRAGWVRLLSVRAGAAGQTDAVGEIKGVLDVGQRRSDPGRVVAVAGLRGLTEEELRGARFDARELDKMNGYAVTAAEAERFARQADLLRRQVAYLPAPQKEPRQTGGTSWGE